MVNPEGLHFIYRHIRPDKNEPFYIGIGTTYKGWDKTNSSKVVFKRAYEFGRNDIWKRIVSKNNGLYRVDIIECSNDYSYIHEKEVELIKLYGRKKDGGILANISLGGEGRLGYSHSDSSKKRMSLSHTGKNMSKEARNKISAANKGKVISDKHKKILSEGQIGGLNCMAEKVIDVFTLEIFDSILSASKAYGVSQDSMGRYLNKKKPNKTTALKLSDYNLIDKSDLINHVLLSSSVKKIIINPESGEILYTLKELALRLNITPAAVTNKLSGKTRNDTGFVKMVDYKLYGKEKCIEMCNKYKCLNIKTGEKYKTQKEAADSICMNQLLFSRRMNGCVLNDTDFIKL